jgi:hypothetical protein
MKWPLRLEIYRVAISIWPVGNLSVHLYYERRNIIQSSS